MKVASIRVPAARVSKACEWEMVIFSGRSSTLRLRSTECRHHREGGGTRFPRNPSTFLACLFVRVRVLVGHLPSPRSPALRPSSLRGSIESVNERAQVARSACFELRDAEGTNPALLPKPWLWRCRASTFPASTKSTALLWPTFGRTPSAMLPRASQSSAVFSGRSGFVGDQLDLASRLYSSSRCPGPVRLQLRRQTPQSPLPNRSAPVPQSLLPMASA